MAGWNKLDTLDPMIKTLIELEDPEHPPRLHGWYNGRQTEMLAHLRVF